MRNIKYCKLEVNSTIFDDFNVIELNSQHFPLELLRCGQSTIRKSAFRSRQRMVLETLLSYCK